MSIYIRTKVESTGPGGLPVNSNSIHKVLGWQPIDAEGNDSMSEEEYILRYGEVGNYILEIKGQVVEETIYHTITESIVVGKVYTRTRGSGCYLCAYAVEDGFILKDVAYPSYYHCDREGQFTGTTDSLFLATKQVDSGVKKKVLKPYVP